MKRVARLVARTIEVMRTSGPRVALRLAWLKLLRTVHSRMQRLRWLVRTYARVRRKDLVRIVGAGPVISVVVPVHNTPPQYLEACIRSVLAQKYPKWELCMCDDNSSRADTRAVLEAFRGTDTRIRIVRSDAPLHISRATNLAAEQATGKYLAFLDHDDCLQPMALLEVARADLSFPDVDLLYSDEDKLDEAGARCDSYFKPDWSPEHLDSVMYLLHLLVIRKSLFWQLGGLRHEVSGAQDYDLALRASARARRIHHIDSILYHWRKIPGSAAAALDAKPYAAQAARRALEDSVRERGLDAEVADGLLAGTFHVRHRLASPPAVTLLIPTACGERAIPGRGRIHLLRNFIGSIVARSTYRNYRVVVVDNGNADAELRRLLAEIGAGLHSYSIPGRFNFANKLNFAARFVETEHVILLNDDLEVVTPDWIEALLGFAVRPEIGAVGARLLYPDHKVQHAGIALGVNGSAAHLFHGAPEDYVGYNGFTHIDRNYSAVTAAVMATRMSVFRALGGFDESFAVDFNDVDFCLRAGAKGLRCVYTPHARLLHFEGSSLQRKAQDPHEQALFRERWAGPLRRDPYYSVNLPRDRADCLA